MRIACVVVLLVATSALPSPRAASGPPLPYRPAPVVPVVYALPLAGTASVVRPFAAPPTPYAAGHRGVDLAAPPGGEVFAASAGHVRFAGTVAGRGLVVIDHPDGVITEYEPVLPAVPAGTSVMGGAVIATVRGTHGSCAVDGCLHWGARRGGTYFDPMTLLSALGPVRLLPWDSAVRPAGGPG